MHLKHLPKPWQAPEQSPESLPADLADAIARAGVDVRLTDRALQDAIKAAVGERRGYLGDRYVDEAGWCVELLYQERETFHGLTLEIALAWCLVYLMSDEFGVGEFAA